MSREDILKKVRTALRRSPGRPPSDMPATHPLPPGTDFEKRMLQFRKAIEELAGKIHFAGSGTDACIYVASLLEGRSAVASNAPFLRECGITALAGVRTGLTAEEELRKLCAAVDIGITSADYALADTGTLVILSSAEEARMISLLPPIHLAVIPHDRILTGLDELFSLVPRPDLKTSSMVFITGSSRTADIEQILIRGVHGPGEIHVVVV
jgi:L-lactate dehydrogenase complex protein LldG